MWMSGHTSVMGRTVVILTPYSYYKGMKGVIVDADQTRYCVTIGAHKRMWFPKAHVEFVK